MLSHTTSFTNNAIGCHVCLSFIEYISQILSDFTCDTVSVSHTVTRRSWLPSSHDSTVSPKSLYGHGSGAGALALLPQPRTNASFPCADTIPLT